MELKITDLTKKYNKVTALNRFNYCFTPGIYGLLGPNGAGKSTLMNLITDNITPTEGSIRWDGEDTKKMGKDYRGKIGYMPQQQGYYSGFSAVDFLRYIGRLKEIRKEKLEEEIEFWLKKVNLYEVRNRKLSALSGGMRQRVMLVQALLGSPELVILDEPTAGLDPKERINMRNIIAEISDQKIVLLATHIVSDIDVIADKVLLIKKGQCIKSDSVENLMKEVKDKAGIIECERKDILKLQEKYSGGNIVRKQGKYYFRKMFETLPEGFRLSTDEISLEDVYLYYFETK